MRNQCARILLATLVVMLLSVAALGQQPSPSDEALIVQLQANIQRSLVPENRPPIGATPQETESYRNMLASFRRQLQKLLWKKVGRLEFQINNYEAPGALPEMLGHAAKLKTELRSINTELANLESELAGTAAPLVIPLAVTAPPALAQPQLLPVNSGAKTEFDTAVANISPEALADAAIPAKVAESAAPQCDDDGAPISATPSKYEIAVCRIAGDVTDADNRDIGLANDQENLMTILIAKLLKTKSGEGESYASFVTEAQELRTDQQVGAGPTSNSATSIVSKGGIPYLLSFAVENGAAEESEKDTAITFRINPGGLINLFNKKGFITSFQEGQNDPVMKFLNKTSVGLTFDTSRGATPGVFTGTQQQLSQVSVRTEFMNQRDPRHKKYAARWEQLVANEGVKLADQTWKTTVALTNWGGREGITFSDPALQAWLNQINVKVRLINPSLTGGRRVNAIAEILNQQADLVPAKLVSEKVVETLTDFAKESKAYDEAKNKVFDEIAKGKIFTLDYTNKREVTAPDTSNFTFIASTGTQGRVDLTANGSFTLFHKRPAATALVPRPGRFRDFQFAGQLDIPFRVSDAQFDFWFSGKYERLLEDAITIAGATMPNTKGDIAVGQFGLNIPIPGLGMKFPVSFTFANRTELVKEKEIRGNFGFTFNWDTLFSKIKPF